MRPGRRTLVALAMGAATPAVAALPASIARIEAESGGRLGVAVLDTGTGATAGHRLAERFPMTSTFKLPLAAAILARGDHSRRVRFTREDLIAWSPVTERRVGGEGMTLAELAEATTTTNDNTAANLLLRALGGPGALTAFLRETGDDTTRLDRIEPELNEALPGDARDTTTPAAMVSTLQRLCLGAALTWDARATLLGWMRANQTGGPLLRAGLPPDWVVGDRTGAGGFHSRAVVAISWPPAGRAPLLVAAFLHEGPAAMPARDAIFARLGAAIAKAAP